jgi:hypothetical protein
VSGDAKRLDDLRSLVVASLAQLGLVEVEIVLLKNGVEPAVLIDSCHADATVHRT